MVGGPRARAESRRRAVAALAVAVLLLVAAASLFVAESRRVRGGGDAAAGPSSAVARTTQAPTPPVDPAVLRRQALDELLQARSAAVLSRDLPAWLATVDPLSGDFVQRQAAVFSNLDAVPLADWRYEYAGDGPALPPERATALGPEAWVARTVVTYRLADAGTGEIRREQALTLVLRGERWLVASTSDGDSSPDLWDLGTVHVVRGGRSLVLGTADSDLLRRVAGETDEAAAHVDLVWGAAWPRTVVVLVPRSQTEMAQLLQRRDELGLDQIAAVTTGEVGRDRGSSADRVVVNPAGFERLGPLGRQVVLRHEITHVATRATAGHEVPIWLSEGFADYVAYRDSGVTRAVVAQDVLRRVREGHLPATLPEKPDFDPALGDIADAYAAAWVAADLIQTRWGEPALMALYRDVAGGATTEEAFRGVLGVEHDEFLQQWRDYLAELAS